LNSGHVLRNPPRKDILIDRAGGKVTYHYDGIRFGSCKFEIVDRQEGDDTEQRRTLVAIDERMVSRDSKGISSSERLQIATFISPTIPRATKRRIQRAYVTNTFGPAELAQLLVVNRYYKVDGQPLGFVHFANSASAFLYVFMAFLAARIPFSKVGS
jgi:hypothetical protein